MTEQKLKISGLAGIFLLLVNAGLFAAAPLVYVIPDSRAVHIILGDVPRNVAAFTVARKTGDSKEFQTLTQEPVRPLSDPGEALALMGADYRWISRRMGLEKPSRLWRKLRADRNTALSLCLVSPGLRLALGRTLIDADVTEGKNYTYRIDLLGLNERTLERITRTVHVQPASEPRAVERVKAEVSAHEIKLTWDYAAYKNSEADITVSFNIYRSLNEKKMERINRAPVLRIEGWLSYLDRDVEYGSVYTYFVEPVDLIGTRGKRVSSPPVKPLDRSAPLVPMGLTAVDVPEGVKLLWRMAPEPDAAGYRIFRSHKLDADYVKISSEPVPFDRTSYLDTTIQRGVCYYYKVTAMDQSGNESPLSGPAVIIPRDGTAPDRIEQFAAAVDDRKLFVALSWKPSPAVDLTGYHIYRGKNRGGLSRITAEPVDRDKQGGYTDTGYKDKGLFPGDTLYYAVTAVDSSFNEGEKVYAEVVIPDNKPPSAVFAFTAKTTPAGAVLLRWQPSLSRDLAHHRVFRKEGREFVRVAELSRELTTWEDTEVARGRQYTYQIVEADTSGNVSKPSAAVSVVPTDIQPPPAPAKITAAIRKGGVELSWDAVPVDDLAGYRVYRLPGGKSSWKLLTARPESGTVYRHTAGKAGDSYAVTAVDTSANESARAVIQVKREKEEE